jgi:RNA polymerase sigma-70 factor (ECF subfamily)
MDPELEKKLVSRAQAGDHQAFVELVDHYKTPVFNLIYRMTNGSLQESDDLAQETFLRSFIGLGSFDLQKRFFPWLYTICLNVIRNYMQKKNPAHAAGYTLPDQLGKEEADNPEALYAQRQENDMVQEGLLRLPEEQRAAIILRFFQDLAYDDIAQILGLSASGVKMRVKRGLASLRSHLHRKK